MHILCTICSDLVNQAENIFATNCGHIFHYKCLSQWISRSKSCPQCRHKITERCMFRIYPTVSDENTGDDATTLQSRLDDTQLQLRQQQASAKEKDEKLTTITAELKKNEEVLKNLENKLVTRESAISAMKDQINFLNVQNKGMERVFEENDRLIKNMQTLNGLQKVLNATSNEVDEMLLGYTDVRTIATFATALKRALCESEKKKNESRDSLQSAKQQLAVEKGHVVELQAKIKHLEGRLAEPLLKRKTMEFIKDSFREHFPVKKPRLSHERSLNDAIILQDIDLTDDTDDSFDTKVTRIEQADSPYLSLKQSSLALTALQQRPQHKLLDSRLKPSEIALINAARDTTKKGPENLPSSSQSNQHSIFHKKELPTIDLVKEEDNISQSNISYDGLGGHSKLDTFPVPSNRPPLKSCVPKLTAKHKLRKPTAPAGSQDIGRILRKRDK